MNLSNIRKSELAGVFDALEAAFSATGTDFYIIGAMAKDIWYSQGHRSSRMTKDVDFAVLVSNEASYNNIKVYLRQNEGFTEKIGNLFSLASPPGVVVDILPFGELEADGTVTLVGGGLSMISVDGFVEVYKEGTQKVNLDTGHRFEVATLPAIIMLKLIAYDDRPDCRLKDARDIAYIIEYFFDLQLDVVYREEHLDLFGEETKERTLQEIAAIIIGGEIRKIVSSNGLLLARLESILRSIIEKGERSYFVQEMTFEIRITIEDGIKYLESMLSSWN